MDEVERALQRELAEQAAAVEPTTDAWLPVRRALVRRRFARGAALGGSTLVVVMAVAVVAIAAPFGPRSVEIAPLASASEEGPTTSPSPTEPSATAAPSVPPPTAFEPVLVEGNGTVLEAAGDMPAMSRHGPELCLGGVALSLPPQCGGVPITNWNWDDVEGGEHVSGVSWGSYHVVGMFDGSSLTLTEPPEAALTYDPGGYDFTPPCPEPEGGWAAAVTSDATDADVNRVLRLAKGSDDYAGGWMHNLEPAGETTDWPRAVVIVAAFTGDIERHEAELREVWDGPLCVVQFEHTYRELRRIQNGLIDVTQELGMEMLSSGVDVSGNVVELGVVWIDEEQRAELERRYGQGLIRVTTGLRAVE